TPSAAPHNREHCPSAHSRASGYPALHSILGPKFTNDVQRHRPLPVLLASHSTTILAASTTGRQVSDFDGSTRASPAACWRADRLPAQGCATAARFPGIPA